MHLIFGCDVSSGDRGISGKPHTCPLCRNREQKQEEWGTKQGDRGQKEREKHFPWQETKHSMSFSGSQRCLNISILQVGLSGTSWAITGRKPLMHIPPGTCRGHYLPHRDATSEESKSSLSLVIIP